MEILLATGAWAATTGMAVAIFARQVRWTGDDLVSMQVVEFAYAFAVASLVASSATLATAGRWRRAVGLFVASGVVLAGTLPTLRSLIFFRGGPAIGWAARSWDDARDAIGPSLAIGVAMSLGVSALPVTSRLVGVRLARWQVGVAVVVAAYALGFWGLPLAVSWVSDLVVPYLRRHYGHRYDELIEVTLAGSGTGALIGAVVTWLATSRRPPGSPSEELERCRVRPASPVGM